MAKKQPIFWTKTILLIGILGLCTACPYESTVPISEAKIPIKKQLIGKWTDAPESNNFIEVKAKSDYLYLIEENVFSRVKKVHEVKKYYAHLSEIDSTLFLNVSPRDSLEKTFTDDSFLLYRLEQVGSDKFKLYPLTKHIKEKFDNSEELRNFIQKYKALSFFYGDVSEFQQYNFQEVKWKN